ncbi:MAG: hypothetical protein AMS17_06285 [Spirochaetes bacterium DG_61]|jgi:uncharacterized protein YgbK (DUF1537 family)|nr:MAG: hypothetical protein AMS17_06285 [Spirochaetes bacterium DG_61]
MMYVIADDLTGAGDTGVQFVKRGYRTIVSIMPESVLSMASIDTDVYVVDTETRDEESTAAQVKLQKMLKVLNIDKTEIVYKKVDSTLRGPIGVEIEEIMKHLGRDICVFTPTFSSYGRITIGGYLVVDGEVLGHSKYYNGKMEPGDASYIPLLLSHQTNIPIARIDLKDVAKGVDVISRNLIKLFEKGNKIIIIDATNEKHLHDIVEASLRFTGSVLYAGSAGLAQHICQGTEFRVIRTLKVAASINPYLIIYASRHPIIQQQIDYLRERVECHELIIDVSKILSDRDGMLALYTEDCLNALESRLHVIIHTHHDRTEGERIFEKAIVKHKTELRMLELQIRQFIGELVSRILSVIKIENIILSGGDTALGVCNALGIQRLQIIDELLPGIPVSLADYNGNPLQLVTKAGGFGEIDTLFELIEKLLKVKEKAHN